MSAGAGRRAPVAVGIVVPVHDEEDLLPAALDGVEEAVDALSPPTSCRVAVVLDDCRDGSSAVARAWAGRVRALVIERECRSVGSARRAGTQALLSLWPDVQPAQIWMATTDADSRVPPDWLTVQLEAYGSGSDLWAGRVGVAEESAAVERWKETYAAERQPIHGASMGFSAFLYRADRGIPAPAQRRGPRLSSAGGRGRLPGDVRPAGSSHHECSAEGPGTGRIRRRVGGRRGRTARGECLKQRDSRTVENGLSTGSELCENAACGMGGTRAVG